MKRNDLQAVRGVAVLLVVLFHLHPHLFPLGFVGVDMFFVLSGFLMAMILSKMKLSASSLWDFYSRRFKRIVPLLYIVLAGVYIGCSFFLFGVDKEQLKKDLLWSLSFLSNIQPLYEVLGYWDQVVSYRFLVHCWSLGVEIQFYLMAPFLIFGTNQLPSLQRRSVLLSLALCSLLFQLNSSPKVAYSLLPSRIWQFLLGSLCYQPETVDSQPIVEKESLLEEKEAGEPGRRTAAPLPWKNKLSVLLLGHMCLIVIVNWDLISETTMRLLGSAVVAVVLLCPSTSLAFCHPLVYVGDISYVMYLIHWPVIVAAKYIEDGERLSFSTTACLCVLIIALSVFLHHTVETFILKSSVPLAFVLSLLCMAFFISTFPYYDKCCSLPTATATVTDINITEAIEYNERESKVVYFNLPCQRDSITEKWTNYTEERQLRCQAFGNGTTKILVIGNSMAYRAFPLISKVLQGRYRELRLYSRSARPPLTDRDPPFTKATKIVVDKMRPDILWNIHVDRSKNYVAPFDQKNKSSDPGYQEIERNLNYYKSRTKVFLIDLPFYWSNITVAYEMAKRLRRGKPVEDLRVEKQEMQKQQMAHRQRIQAVPCEHCVYLDVESKMIDHGTYWLYNRKNLHTYSKDGAHFTWEMLDRIEPLYKKAVDDALGKLNT